MWYIYPGPSWWVQHELLLTVLFEVASDESKTFLFVVEFECRKVGSSRSSLELVTRIFGVGILFKPLSIISVSYYHIWWVLEQEINLGFKLLLSWLASIIDQLTSWVFRTNFGSVKDSCTGSVLIFLVSFECLISSINVIGMIWNR